MDSNLIKKGQVKINELLPNGDQPIIQNFAEIAPDMSDYILGFIFGSLYSREGLDLKTKQIITITSLAVLANAKPQLAYHINCGLNIGISRKEIVDIMIHISGYAGFPVSLNAIATAKEVFNDRDSKGISN